MSRREAPVEVSDDSAEEGVTSEELLARFVAHSKAGRKREAESAFSALHRREKLALRSFVFKAMGGKQPFIAQGGDEVCQDAWIAIAKSAGTFQKKAKFTTWAYKITLRLLAAHVYKKEAAKSVQAPFDENGGQPILDNAPDRASPPPHELEKKELLTGFQEALMKLDEKQRQVFVLRETEGLPWHEVSEIMGAHKNTLEHRLFLAVESLKSLLRGHSPEQKQGASHGTDA
jgi:RNA polymerase sigma-70 factor, ECF subfamily